MTGTLLKRCHRFTSALADGRKDSIAAVGMPEQRLITGPEVWKHGRHVSGSE